MFLLLDVHIEQIFKTRPDQKVGRNYALYICGHISPTGEPKEPKKAADVFKKQCGVLIRDHVPITVREWNKRKGANDSDYVAERYKEGLWTDLMAHFILPELEDEAGTAKLRDKVKEWTLKKMAELFRVWKKRLWQDYKKKKTAPVFEGHLAK